MRQLLRNAGHAGLQRGGTTVPILRRPPRATRRTFRRRLYHRDTARRTDPAAHRPRARGPKRVRDRKASIRVGMAIVGAVPLAPTISRSKPGCLLGALAQRGELADSARTA